MITAAVYLVGALAFVALCTAETQPWAIQGGKAEAQPAADEEAKSEEMKPLNK
jgi:hypothetical protein